jgi:hemolysin activation/secretion protein
VTVYPPAELESYYASLIGTDVTLTQMTDLAAQLTTRYRADGYILAQVVVPEQQIEGGVVRMVAVEGFIDRVLIEGEIKGPQRIIEEFTDRIRAERPLTSAALERNLLLIGDLPGVNVRSVLEPSPTTFGAADLHVVLTHLPAEGFASIDNRGSKFIGPWTLAAGASAYSLFGGYEQLDVLGATTPDSDELQYVHGRLSIPTGFSGSGDVLQLFAAYSWTRPDLTSTAFPFETPGTLLEVRTSYVHPFIRSRTQSLSGSMSLIWRDAETRFSDFPSGPGNPSNDHVRVVQLQGSYDLTDRFFGVNLATLALNQGIGILGASDVNDSVSRTTGADGTFTYLNASLSRLQDLSGGFALYVELDGQYSFQPLLSTERFGLGGVRIGRGYPPGDITGDRGIGGTIELRYGEAVNISGITSYQAYAFVDAGRTWDIGDAPHVRGNLLSTGLGIRLNIFDRFALNPEVARQLSGAAADRLNGGPETRFLISLIGRF